jgi:hypothetical protein
MPTPAVVFLWMRVTARGSWTSFAASWGARYRLLPYVYAQVTLCSEVQEGASVWFSSRDKKKTTAGLDQMAAQIKEQLGGAQPKLMFHFDCAARGKVMVREQEKLELLRWLRKAVGPEEKHNCYHKYTAVVLTLS